LVPIGYIVITVKTPLGGRQTLDLLKH